MLAGPQQAGNVWTDADALTDLSLTFDSLKLAKVTHPHCQALISPNCCDAYLEKSFGSSLDTHISSSLGL